MQKKSFGRAGSSLASKTRAKDRRGKRRKSEVEAGKLSSKYNPKGLDCTISDISDSGASVLVKVDVSAVPKEVVLVRLRNRVSHRATVVWRKGQRVGLKFAPTASSLVERLFSWAS